jgi:hypothetical protein
MLRGFRCAPPTFLIVDNAKLRTKTEAKKKLPRWWEFGRVFALKWGEFSLWVGVFAFLGRFWGEFRRVLGEFLL